MRNVSCLTMTSFSLDFTSLATSLVTALLAVFGLILVCKFSVLSRCRWWKDLKIVLGWLSLLPHYYKLRKITGRELWREAVRKHADKAFIWSLTYCQVEDWCSELESEVFSDLEPGRPVGVFVDDPQLGVIVMVTGLKVGTPLVLYHLAAVGDLLHRQLAAIPEVDILLVSASRIPQIQDADKGWQMKNNLWIVSLRFRSLAVMERVGTEEKVEDEDTSDEELEVDVEVETEKTEEAIYDFREKYANVFIFFFTSGTTGFSKATMVTVSKFALMGPLFARELSVTSRDVIMTISPVTRMMWMITVALATGCAIQPNNGVNTLPFEIKATILYTGFKKTYDLVDGLEAGKNRLQKLRLWMALGFPGNTAPRITLLYPALQLMNYYGSCEGVVALFNHDILEACGYRIKYFVRRTPVQLLKIDDTDTVIRDPDTGFCTAVDLGLLVKRRNRFSSMNRYVNIPEERSLLRSVFEAGDVYEMTGDIMRDDGDGNLFFVKRTGDSFRFRNYNGTCEQIERLLYQLPAVRCCAVYALPHIDYPNRVAMAAIQLHKHVTTTTKCLFLSIYHHLDNNSGVKPLFFRIVEEFSELETGKIDKQKLRKEGFSRAGVVFILDDNKRTFVTFTCPLRLLVEDKSNGIPLASE